jgi:hypothetical protein
MQSRLFVVVGLIILFIIPQHSGISGQKFVYKFDQGKAYRYSSNIESKTSGQMGGQEFTVSSGVQLHYSVTLTEKSANTLTLNAVIEKFEMKINMPMMGFKDSVISMPEMIGKRIQVKITPQGKSVSVTPIDTVKPSRLLMMGNVNPVDLFQRVFFEFPDKELDVNGTWKKTDPDTIKRSGMKMITKNNVDFTVAGKEKNNDFQCWKILIAGKSTVEGSGNQQGADVTVDGTVKTNGTAFAAPADCVFVGAEQATESDITITATGSQSGASTMSSSTKMKTVLVK